MKMNFEASYDSPMKPQPERRSSFVESFKIRLESLIGKFDAISEFEVSYNMRIATQFGEILGVDRPIKFSEQSRRSPLRKKSIEIDQENISQNTRNYSSILKNEQVVTFDKTPYDSEPNFKTGDITRFVGSRGVRTEAPRKFI